MKSKIKLFYIFLLLVLVMSCSNSSNIESNNNIERQIDYTIEFNDLLSSFPSPNYYLIVSKISEKYNDTLFLNTSNYNNIDSQYIDILLGIKIADLTFKYAHYKNIDLELEMIKKLSNKDGFDEHFDFNNFKFYKKSDINRLR